MLHTYTSITQGAENAGSLCPKTRGGAEVRNPCLGRWDPMLLRLLFKDLYKEITIRSPKKVGYSGLRRGLEEASCSRCKVILHYVDTCLFGGVGGSLRACEVV